MTKRQFRILLIDDDAAYCRMLTQQLQAWGYNALSETDDRKAREAFLEFEPQVVLLDVRLAHGDCLPLLKDILAEDSKVAVILLTANKDEAIAKKAMSMGASDFITKPYDTEELQRVLRWQLKQDSSGS